MQESATDKMATGEMVSINVRRGSSMEGMQDGVISSSPASFVNKVSKCLCRARCSVPPSMFHHYPRTTALVPRRSSCLTKKAHSCMPAVAAMQIVLMKKLVLSQVVQVQMVDFEAYIWCFKELFIDHLASVSGNGGKVALVPLAVTTGGHSCRWFPHGLRKYAMLERAWVKHQGTQGLHLRDGQCGMLFFCLPSRWM
jgi:hypothetical protein